VIGFDAEHRAIRFYRFEVPQFHVYILASHYRRLYVGVTNDLQRRLWEHNRNWSGFSARYQTKRLVYYEVYRHPMSAIRREKQLKKLYRAQKIDLIESTNPVWIDLAEGWFDSPADVTD
jgi:putative endonuclease